MGDTLKYKTLNLKILIVKKHVGLIRPNIIYNYIYDMLSHAFQKKYILILLVLLSSSFVYGHGDIHKRIKTTTVEIKANPDSAYLYLKRGELFLQHEAYKKGLKDFKKAQKLGWVDVRLDYAMANAYYKMNEFAKATNWTNRILDYDINYVKAHRLKGLSLFKSHEFKLAAQSFEDVIQLASERLPENYFEASLAWQKSKHEDAYQKSVDYILIGIDDLGPLISFYHQLVKLAQEQSDYKKVIDYQTQIIDLSDRKERAYYNRGLTYLAVEDHSLAQSDFLLAKKAIDLLNIRLQNQKPTKELIKLIHEKLPVNLLADK